VAEATAAVAALGRGRYGLICSPASTAAEPNGHNFGLFAQRLCRWLCGGGSARRTTWPTSKKARKRAPVTMLSDESDGLPLGARVISPLPLL